MALHDAKARKWIDGRKNWRKELLKKRKPDEKWIWFHCSSVGEYEDSCIIFSEILKQCPEKKSILTFFSPSGYELLKESPDYDLVMYLPLDTKKNAKDFLAILKPQVILFSRSELWYNLIVEIKKRKIPAFLLSLKLNNKSSFIKWPPRILSKDCFTAYTFIYCQDELTQKLLIKYFNVFNNVVTGNPRFDKIYKESMSLKTIPCIMQFVENSFVIVAGSVLPKDEEKILKVIKCLDKYNIKFIIVPHEIKNERIDYTINKIPGKAIRYSDIHKLTGFHNILYIDFVGALKYLYKYANFAVIGGGFDHIGIHNIVEPAVYGVKTAFGPNHKNYREAIDLIKIGGATIYNNESELLNIITNEIENPSDVAIKNEIMDYVRTNAGAGKKITDSLITQFSELF